MEQEAHSLSSLRDIALPDPPSLWPLTPGMCLLLVLILLPLIALTLHRIQEYRKNAYRRAGLKQLQSIRSIDELQVLLKRVALTAFPRPKVAPLHGKAWCQFLETTCSQVSFSKLLVPTPDTVITEPVRKQAARWIRHHKTEGGPS
jgi:hypothetical protein